MKDKEPTIPTTFPDDDDLEDMPGSSDDGFVDDEFDESEDGE